MTTIFPQTRDGWLHFVFCALETIVVMLTVRDAGVRLPSMHGERFADSFYWFYWAAILALAIVAFCIRRPYPELSRIGWVTSGLAFLWSGIDTPIY